MTNPKKRKRKRKRNVHVRLNAHQSAVYHVAGHHAHHIAAYHVAGHRRLNAHQIAVYHVAGHHAHQIAVDHVAGHHAHQIAVDHVAAPSRRPFAIHQVAVHIHHRIMNTRRIDLPSTWVTCRHRCYKIKGPLIKGQLSRIMGLLTSCSCGHLRNEDRKSYLWNI
ncbi:hypothetical protein F0562_009939 [Nyssa sinensis]|uniref:Uncharacterized protein n=1 Tax=Nyssa sinensis TaxID=561372 RepID=A0A5J5A0B0_9ASTE|nr:hypothetical protein F0562_009939 [Nyssa sinensis]